MGRRKKNPTLKVLRQRMNYWKRKRGIDQTAAIILAIHPSHVVRDFKQVEKKHGRKHAVSWLKGKYK